MPVYSVNDRLNDAVTAWGLTARAVLKLDDGWRNFYARVLEQ